MTVREMGYLKSLHNLVIHQRKGTNKQYHLETRKLALLDDKTVRIVCSRCFGKPLDENTGTMK